MDVLSDHRIPRQFQTGAMVLKLGKVPEGFKMVSVDRLSSRYRRCLDELPPLGAGR
jgi:hypothetical protein